MPNNAAKATTKSDKPLPTQRREQQALVLLFFYRLLIGMALLIVIHSGHGMHALAAHNSTLFSLTSYSYLFLATLSGVVLRFQLFAPSTQTQFMFIVDVISIPILMHAGIGITSGMGTLLAVTIAMSSLILPGILVLFFAAIATFSIFAQLLLSNGMAGLPLNQLTHAGLLGAAFFFIAALSSYLSHRVRAGESLALRQAADLANLSRLNQLIIEQMATGVVVADDTGSISYINNAARRLMRIPMGIPVKNLIIIFPELYLCMQQWFSSRTTDKFTVSTERRRFHAHFRESGLGNSKTPLIFLEDATEAMKQAQQIKLASLGRLTAGIAHQIRNPLSSINHAGQLLAESPSITEADKRLTKIIHNNSIRVNEIIESILQLSKRQTSSKRSLLLSNWLNDFTNEFLQQNELDAKMLTLSLAEHGKNIEVRADRLQLDQIMNNLCGNAIQHFNAPPENLHIEIRLDINENQACTLDVIDNGPGFSTESREQLFEPFFTTSSDGTGLGLYIAKELSDANGIDLSLIPSNTGAHFRLRFPSNRE